MRPDAPATLPPADVEAELALGESASLDVRRVTSVARLDVHFSIDTTGSFGGEIDQLQASLDTQIVPELTRRVPSVALGVSRFEDFPEPPFGAPTDHAFLLLSPITTDLDFARRAVAELDQPLGNGGDFPESSAEALFQIATGLGYQRLGVEYIARRVPAPGRRGGVDFRDDAYGVVIHVTDATTHTPSDYERTFPVTHSLMDATNALVAIRIPVIGIASGVLARPHLEQVAIATTATTPPTAGACATGINRGLRPPVAGVCPLVFDIDEDGTGLSTALVDALVGLLDRAAFAEVWAVAEDDRLHFVERIVAIDATAPGGVAVPRREDRRPTDGFDDTFVDVRTGTTVHFRLDLANHSIPQMDRDQSFRITVRVFGDGRDLGATVVRIVVPARPFAPPDAGLSDSGVDADGDGAPDVGPDGSALDGELGAADAATVDS